MFHGASKWYQAVTRCFRRFHRASGSSSERADIKIFQAFRNVSENYTVFKRRFSGTSKAVQGISGSFMGSQV